MRKQTYPALFPADTFIEVNIASIDEVFVESHDSPRRRLLASHLRLFVGYLRNLGLQSFEIWIDGSFSTADPTPGDVDITCFIPRHQLRKMTDENLEKLEYLASEEGRPYIRERWHIDYYHCPFDSLEARNYWKDKFTSDDYGNRKGIGRIKI